MLKCLENCGPRHPPKRVMSQKDVEKYSSLLYTYKFSINQTKNVYNRAKELYCGGNIYSFLDSLLSTCPKKM